MNEWAVKKAKLLASPPIYIPKDSLPRFLEVSSTGPGAGTRSVFIRFGNHRVIKEVSSAHSSDAFVMRRNGGSYDLFSPDGSLFLSDVEVERSIIHAPGQAFLNIEQRCVFHCAFCTSRRIKNRTAGLSDEKILDMLDDAVGKGAKGVALTSGVWPDINSSVERVASLLSEFHEAHPDVVLGAEIYTESREDLLRLKESGVTELKINVEVATKGLCEKLCPEKDFERVHAVLEEAVSIFGRGSVTSNIIYGLGESDEDVLSEAERLAGMGVIPNLRALRLNHANVRTLRNAGIEPERVSSGRMLALATAQKEILERHNLATFGFKTMCFACSACDIQPFIDF